MNLAFNKSALIAALALVLLGGGTGAAIYLRSAAPEPVYCTMEAKLCPDGSYVGRTGPKCEFALCPAQGAENSWKTFSDTKTGSSFKYPETLTTTYIHAVDWPPKVQIMNEPFTCTEAGAVDARADKTEKRTVDGRTYCVTEVTGAAAGSMYTQYAYAKPKDIKAATLTFSLQFPQCANFADAEQIAACEGEQAAFSIDGIIDRIFTTLTFSSESGEVPVKIFYYNSDRDKDTHGNIMCSRAGLVPVERALPKTDSLIEDTIRLLLRGEISPNEKATGVMSEYPLPGLELQNTELKNGELTLVFFDSQNRTSGGSCRVGILWSQIEATAKQFPGVERVRFLPEELFQP